jgi:hypothetical protein
MQNEWRGRCEWSFEMPSIIAAHEAMRAKRFLRPARRLITAMLNVYNLTQ